MAARIVVVSNVIHLAKRDVTVNVADNVLLLAYHHVPQHAPERVPDRLLER